MTALRDAYPPVGVPVRVYQNGIVVGFPPVTWVLEVWGDETHYHMWHAVFNPTDDVVMAVDETRDAWEAV